TLDAIAVGDQLGIDGVGARRVVDALRRRRTAPRRKYPQVVIGVALQQGALPLGQQGGILRDVALVDLVEHRVGREGVRMVHARRVAGRWLYASRPGRDAAGGIACTFSAQRSEILPQARGLGFIDLCLDL